MGLLPVCQREQMLAVSVKPPFVLGVGSALFNAPLLRVGAFGSALERQHQGPRTDDSHQDPDGSPSDDKT